MAAKESGLLLPRLTETVRHLAGEFDRITADRKTSLEDLTRFIRTKADAGEKADLNFICTHNSRRSHMAQLWAQLAVHYYGLDNISCFSGGTEATAFNPGAVKAMQDAGFVIRKSKDGDNPVYDVRFSPHAPAVAAFSKKYDHPANPQRGFAAIMTCSHADQNCPVVHGASARISLTYDDPKAFDGTAKQEEKYAERVHEIGRDILYAFSRVKNQR